MTFSALLLLLPSLSLHGTSDLARPRGHRGAWIAPLGLLPPLPRAVEELSATVLG